MDFVPAGYCECEDGEEFDFGDNYVPGQYEGGPIEVIEPSKAPQDAPLTQDKPLTLTRAGNYQEGGKEGEAKSCSSSDSYLGGTCSPSPVKGGKGSLSTDCSSDTSQSSINSYHGNQNNLSNSPVTFKISNSRQESLEESDDVGGGVPEPTSTLMSGGRKDTCDLGTIRSSGELKALEVEEDMKVAVARGNVEYVTRRLDNGRVCRIGVPTLA